MSTPGPPADLPPGSGPDAAPDLIEPLLGIRAWGLGSDGTLVAVASNTVWTPGVNQARCWATEGRNPHKAPGANCRCGLYALNHVPNESGVYGRSVVGAIAAWGEIELHRTGFRAEFAQVIALRIPLRPDAGKRVILQQAAQTYGVPLIARDDFIEAVSRLARPAPEALLPKLPKPRPKKPRRPRPARGRPAASPKPREEPTPARVNRKLGPGIWIARHTAVTWSKRGLRITPTPALWALLGKDRRLTRAKPVGSKLEAGDWCCSIRFGCHELDLFAPIGGKVTAIADRLDSRSRWCVELFAGPKYVSETPINWGRLGVEAYRHRVLSLASDRRVLKESGASQLMLAEHDARVRRAKEVWVGRLIRRLDEIVRKDRSLQVALDAVDCTAVFRCDGDLDVALARTDNLWRFTGVASGSENLVIEMDFETLQSYWSGATRQSGGRPVSTPEIARGSAGQFNLLSSFLQRLFPAARKEILGMDKPDQASVGAVMSNRRLLRSYGIDPSPGCGA